MAITEELINGLDKDTAAAIRDLVSRVEGLEADELNLEQLIAVHSATLEFHARLSAKLIGLPLETQYAVLTSLSQTLNTLPS